MSPLRLHLGDLIADLLGQEYVVRRQVGGRGLMIATKRSLGFLARIHFPQMRLKFGESGMEDRFSRNLSRFALFPLGLWHGALSAN